MPNADCTGVGGLGAGVLKASCTVPNLGRIVDCRSVPDIRFETDARFQCTQTSRRLLAQEHLIYHRPLA